MKAVFAGLFALTLNSVPASANEAFSSTANLNLIDSVSSVPLADLTAPNYESIASNFYVPIYEEYFVNHFLINGYTYLPFQPGAGANFPPTATIYNTSNGTLVQTGVLPAQPGLGVLFTAISPSANQPFIAVSTFSPLSAPPFDSWQYVLNIYQYDPLTGIINQTPVDSLNFAQLSPNLNTTQITYNSSTSFSFDGKYLFYTNTIGNPATSQVFGALEILSNGTINTTPVAVTTLPDGPQADQFFVPEAVRSYIRPPQNPHKYKLITGLLGIMPGNISGGAVQASYLQSYNFDPIGGHLDLTGSVPLPSGVQGIDLHPNHNRVLVVSHNVASGPSVEQIPAPPFPTGAPDPINNFRLYSFNELAQNNALAYISGHSLGSDGQDVRWSNSGKFAAITTTPISVTAAIVPLSTGAISTAYVPSVVTTLAYNNDKFTQQDSQPAAPFSFNLAWNSNDSLLGVSGEPTPFQKNVQLYDIVNCTLLTKPIGKIEAAKQGIQNNKKKINKVNKKNKKSNFQSKK